MRNHQIFKRSQRVILFQIAEIEDACRKARLLERWFAHGSGVWVCEREQEGGMEPEDRYREWCDNSDRKRE